MKENKGLENLKVWQLARDLKREIYNISDMFPKKEDYCLTSQIRSAAVSITANISEGYGRYHYQENLQFCRISRGSISETIDHLYTALDAGYINKEKFDLLYTKAREIERTLNGYMRYLQNSEKQLM